MNPCSNCQLATFRGNISAPSKIAAILRQRQCASYQTHRRSHPLPNYCPVAMLSCIRTSSIHSPFLNSCIRSSKLLIHPSISISLYRDQKRFAASTSTPRLPLAARIVSLLPPKAKPYAYLARLDKPVGSWLLYWPCGIIPLRNI